MSFKKFKSFLTEEQQILNEYTKHPISELIAYRGIPLVPSMMDRLGFLENEIQAYHVTNSEYLDEMKRNENKNKQISCFTQGGPELARLPSQPNVLLILEGTSVIRGETDIWTLVSTKDRRWLDLKDYSKTSGKLYKYISGVLQQVVQKAGLDVDVYSTEPKTLAGLIETLDPHEKVSLYRLYLTEMEYFLNKSYKVLNTYLKNAADMKYNEIILTKWEILDAWCLDYEQPAVINKLSKLGISYAGVMPRRDLSKLKIG